MGFWRIFFGALLAFFVGLLSLFLLLLLVMSALVASFSYEKPVTVKPNSVLHLNLNYEIPEQTRYDPAGSISWDLLEPRITVGLYDLVTAIRSAESDDRIKGIYLNCGFVGAGMATVAQIRDALQSFRESGKFVVAYAEAYSERGYYLSSVADRLFINPQGMLEFNGINVQYMFFRRMLEKLGVEPQVFFAGRFKTASEPFRLDSMSAANEQMTRWLIDDLYGLMLGHIGASRKLPLSRLDSISQNFLARTPSAAVSYGLADSMLFDDQVRSYLRRQLQLADSAKIPFISLSDYVSAVTQNRPAASERVAILFAEGDIVDGKGSRSNIGSARYADLLRKLRDDKRVKAVVLRINSGGGSALASDVIAREVKLTAARKPVVVSMGDVAGSGGYYIGAPGTRIMAMPSTLTGSIGVFGVFPNTQKLFNEKLGITFDHVKTGRFADFGDAFRPLRDDERLILQQLVDSIYRDFLAVVAAGRGMSLQQVDSIGEGRVWTGRQALERRLVDTLGSVSDAIALAARLAGLADYRVVQYPEPDRDLMMLVEALSRRKEESALRRSLGEWYDVFHEARHVATLKGVQARMPAVPYIH